MTKVLVYIKIDMFDERTECYGEVKLVEGHVPGVEVSNLKEGGPCPGLVYELHHLPEQIAPADVGEAGEALQQLGVPGHGLRCLEEDDCLQTPAEE